MNTTTFKQLLIAALLLLPLSILAEEPPSDINGEELKQWLKTNFYDGKHTTLEYGPARLEMYTDIDNDNGKIVCVYSGYEHAYQESEYTNPAPINCEHTVPQSFFDSEEPMRSDIHHLFPTYGTWNTKRSNYPFAEIDDAKTSAWMYLDNSLSDIPAENIDLYSEYYSSTFEPREDHKGNCARAIFYFFTMYPNKVTDITRVGEVDVLYQWHLDDPVDDAERARNSAIVTAQGNSNPYIEYPDLVERAWVDANAGPNAPVVSIESTLENITLTWGDLSNETSYKVYRSTDNSNYTEVSEENSDVTTYIDTDVVEDVSYYYYVSALNDNGISPQSNVVSAALKKESTGNSTDLFFSEYIEGSSFNKALELANFTGGDIDLSNYSVKKQTNGAGDWTNEYVLSGTLSDQDVFVICHSDAAPEIQSKADVSENIQIVNFNGNDPVGLFKNGVLIDEIGAFNSGGSDFAKDKTLIRKEAISKPNASYDEDEWTVKSQNYFSNLGTHTLNIPTDIDNVYADKLDLTVYPIPADEYVTVRIDNIMEGGDLTIQLFDMTGSLVYQNKKTVFDTQFATDIPLITLSKGLYLLNIYTGSQTVSKRVIVK